MQMSQAIWNHKLQQETQSVSQLKLSRQQKRPPVIKLRPSQYRSVQRSLHQPMSLNQRLKQLQQPVEDAELPDMSHYRLEDLHHQKVDFGNKHRGEKFEVAWKGQSWVSFIATHYAQSRCMSHRLVIRYIELMIEKHEMSGAPIKMMPDNLSEVNSLNQRPVVPRPVMKAKAKPMALNRSQMCPADITHLPDMEEADWELSSQTYQPGYMASPPLTQDPNFLAMQTRLLHMENALGRVIQHLEGQVVATNPECQEDSNTD